jgi:tRNA (guanine37-N1)-methyltransferase
LRRDSRSLVRVVAPVQLDVFTLIPHAFSWMTEHRPLASVLGSELELRLWSYRDFTPLRAGQVDDEPYGGGAGMVLRVDVVCSALDGVYGDWSDRRIVALTPGGRPLDQALVEELAAEEALTLLSARYEGFDERVVGHVATDAVSIGPYVLSGGELPAMVLLDAVARRLPGALREESGLVESFSAELEGGLEYPHYTRPAEYRGWRVPDVLLSGNHAAVDEWRRGQSRERSLT